MTRKLSVLAATCALGLCAFGGTASADPKLYPGCRGDYTAQVVAEAEGNGLKAALEARGQTKEEFRELRNDICAEFVDPF